MAPRSESTLPPIIPEPESFKPTSNGRQGAKGWLKGKAIDDNIGSKRWRVHDKLYDLSDFASRHPGGKQWIDLTEGTDITEAFEVAHLDAKRARAALDKFCVGDANGPRVGPTTTFHANGFYNTLKSRVVEILRENGGPGATKEMLILQDALTVGAIAAMCGAAMSGNIWVALAAGFVLGMSTTSSHNFFHQKSTFRRYYWDLSCFNSTDWRISHMLSHHLHTNTYCDIETTSMFPFLDWWPRADKHWMHKIMSPLYYHFIFIIIAPIEFLKRNVCILKGFASFVLEIEGLSRTERKTMANTVIWLHNQNSMIDIHFHFLPSKSVAKGQQVTMSDIQGQGDRWGDKGTGRKKDQTE